MSFIENIQKNGRQINVKVTILGITPIVLESDKVFKLDRLFEADFFRSSMTQIDGELKGRYDLTDKTIKVELGVSFGGSVYEYINFGEFIVKEHERIVGNTPEFDKTVFKAFDKMILFHKPYDVVELGITYPISVYNLLNSLATSVGLVLDNVSIVNGGLMVDEDKWTDVESVTYRNVLDEIAQVSGSTIIISGNKLKAKYVGSSLIDLYEENLRKIKIEEKYGGINIFNLTREPQHDNYVYPSDWETIPVEDRVELVFINNQIMDKSRSVFAPDLFNSVNGLEFYPFDADTTGLAFLEPMDAINVIDMNEVDHLSYVMHSRLVISSGLKETLKAVVPMYAKKEYVLVTDVKKERSRTEFLVDKLNGQISGVVSDVVDLEGQVSSNSAQLVIQAGQIATKVSQTDFNALGVRVGTAESTITQQAGQIATKVSQTDLNTQLSNYSTLTQTSNAIALEFGDTAKQTAMNGVSVLPQAWRNSLAGAVNPFIQFQQGSSAVVPSSSWGFSDGLNVIQFIGATFGRSNYIPHEPDAYYSIEATAYVDSGGGTLFIGLEFWEDIDVSTQVNNGTIYAITQPITTTPIVFPLLSGTIKGTTPEQRKSKYVRVRILTNWGSSGNMALNNIVVRKRGTATQMQGARYVFDGSKARFYGDGQEWYDGSGNLKVSFDTVNNRFVFKGQVEADTGLIGRFAISGNDLVYTSDLFNKDYDRSDLIKLQRLGLGLEPTTPYDLAVYDFDNSGTLGIFDLFTLDNFLTNGVALPTPRKRIRSIVRIGTSSGALTTQAQAENGSLGPVTTIRGEKITGDLVNANLIGAKAANISQISSDGISFSGVPSTNTRTLDDYEEGTWTPTVTRSGGVTLAYTNRVGKYTKIGNRVTVDAHIVFNVTNAGTGFWRVGNLPFVPSTTSLYRAGASTGNCSFGIDGGYCLDNDIALVMTSNGGLATTGSTGNATIIVSISYEV